ncbi:hypothetical protein ACFVIM_03160 [Streptomyces sp. NPDC057638]|uniref:hypothetical protein n=1 Tax=Streptomyces sp. NPDC057638 TaxID=3346190 RepID=UPI0036D1E0E1
MQVTALLPRRIRKRRRNLCAILTGLCSAGMIMGAQTVAPERDGTRSPAQDRAQVQSRQSHTPTDPRRDTGGGVQPIRPAAPAAPVPAASGFRLRDPLWTTSHIRTGDRDEPHNMGLVVGYLTPPGHNPYTRGDWIGIHPVRAGATPDNRVFWEWVCPNAENRCTSFGAAAIGVGDNRIASGQTYTIAYWKGGTRTGGRPAATIEWVVPW